MGETRPWSRFAGFCTSTWDHLLLVEGMDLVTAEPTRQGSERPPGPRALPVSIVVPVYNEDPEVVRRLAADCHAAYGDTELIIVDDGSRPPQPLAPRSGPASPTPASRGSSRWMGMDSTTSRTSLVCTTWQPTVNSIW